MARNEAGSMAAEPLIGRDEQLKVVVQITSPARPAWRVEADPRRSVLLRQTACRRPQPEGVLTRSDPLRLGKAEAKFGVEAAPALGYSSHGESPAWHLAAAGSHSRGADE
jgi:hypothetical protein